MKYYKVKKLLEVAMVYMKGICWCFGAYIANTSTIIELAKKQGGLKKNENILRYERTENWRGNSHQVRGR